MKKAINVSIAQTIFTLEEDAYQQLDRYLKSIREHFEQIQDYSEIIDDIEARISEKFLETNKKIITLKGVKMMIESVGEVEDFEEEGGGAKSQIKAKKKLYRNTQEKFISGVCSGLAAYFKINPLWVRIIFIGLTLVTYGFWIFAYIGLALVIPAAKTTSQALEMKGAPVNLETISQNLKGKLVSLGAGHGSKVSSSFRGYFPMVLLLILIAIVISFFGVLLNEGSMDEFITLTLALALVGGFILWLKKKFSSSQESSYSKIEAIVGWPFSILKRFIEGILKIVGPLIRIASGIFITIASVGMIVFISIASYMFVTKAEALLDIPFRSIVSSVIFFLSIISIYVLFSIPLLIVLILGVSLIKKKNFLSMNLGLFFLFLWSSAVATGGVGVFTSITDFEAYLKTNELYATQSITPSISENIQTLIVKDDINVTLVQGDTPSLNIKGRRSLVQAYQVVDEGGVLTLSQKNTGSFCFFCHYGKLEATLTLPSIDNIQVNEDATITIEQWESETPLTIEMNYDSSGIMNIQAPFVEVDAKLYSYLDLTLNGSAASLLLENSSYIDLEGQVEVIDIDAHHSEVNAQNAQIDEAKIRANDSQIHLPSLKKIEVVASNGSSVVYKKSPDIEVISESIVENSFFGSEEMRMNIQDHPEAEHLEFNQMYDEGVFENQSSEPIFEASIEAPIAPETESLSDIEMADSLKKPSE